MMLRIIHLTYIPTVRPGNAYYPVAPDFGPLSLDHLLEPYLYLPELQRRMYEGVEDEGV